jgi:ankyrin
MDDDHGVEDDRTRAEEMKAVIKAKDIEGLKRLLSSTEPTGGSQTAAITTAGASPIHLACEYNFLEGVKYLHSTHQYSLVTCDDVVNKNTPMHLACIRGHVEIVKTFINDFDITTTNSNGYTLLHVARSLDMVKFLMDKGLKPDQETEQDCLNMLHIASKSNNIEIVKYLVEELKMDPNCSARGTSQRAEGQQPVHFAATAGSLNVLKYLIDECRCDPNATDSVGRTPMVFAGQANNIDLMKYLVKDKGCSATVSTKSGDKIVAGRQAIHGASFAGNLDIMRFLINECDVSPYVQDVNGITPLACAAQEGHLDIVKLLCTDARDGFDPSIQDNSGRTPLHYACLKGRKETVAFMVDSVERIDVNVLDNSGESPVIIAALNKHVDVVYFLVTNDKCNASVGLSKGRRLFDIASNNDWVDIVTHMVTNDTSDPESPNEIGLTPIHYAADGNAVSVLNYFLQDRKCNPNLPSNDGYTPLLRACQFGSLESVKFLIHDCKCDASIVSASQMMSPLHLACCNGHLNVITFLIESCGHDKESVNYQNATPLHLAILNGHLTVVKYLIEEQGCDPMRLSDNKFTGVHVACQAGHVSILIYLLEKIAADHSQKWYDKAGSASPLHVAAERGHLDVVQYLVYNSVCNPQIKDENGLTPLHKAVLKGHHDVVVFLVDGEFCNVVDPDYVSLRIPLHLACEKGHVDIVKYLLTKDKKQVLCKDSNNATPLTLASNAKILSKEVLRGFMLAGVSYSEMIKVAPEKCNFMKSCQFLYSHTKVFMIGKTQSLAKQLNDFYQQDSQEDESRLPVRITCVNDKMIGNVIYYEVSPRFASMEGVLSDAITSCEHPVFVVCLNALEGGFSETDIKYCLQFASSLMVRYCKVPVVPVLLFSLTIDDSISSTDVSAASSYILTHSIPQYNQLISSPYMLYCNINHPHPFGASKLIGYLSFHSNSLQQSLPLKVFPTVLRSFAMKLFQDGSLSRSLSAIADQISREDAPLSTDINELAEAFTDLSQSGYLLFIRNSKNLSSSLIIMEVELVLTFVSGVMDTQLTENSLALATEDEICSKTDSPLEPSVLLDLMQYMNVCTIVPPQLQVPNMEPPYYYIPYLLSSSQPSNLTINTDPSTEVCLGWLLQCEAPYIFDADMCIQLPVMATSSVSSYSNCTAWHGGVYYTQGDSLQLVVTHLQKQSIVVIIKDSKDNCWNLTKARLKIVQNILRLKDTLCPHIATQEYLLHPSCLNSFSLDSFPSLSAIPLDDFCKTLGHTKDEFNCTVEDIVGLDPLFIIDTDIVRKCLDPEQSQMVLTSSDINEVSDKFGSDLCHYQALAEMLNIDHGLSIEQNDRMASTVVIEWMKKGDYKRTYLQMFNQFKEFSIFPM